MTEPRWVSLVHILAIHSDQIQAHGRSLGLRDRGLLESAIERPRNRLHYNPDSDLSTLAAAYGFGLANNHPFVDGNKRVGIAAAGLFLRLNGNRLSVGNVELEVFTLRVAQGESSIEEIAAWLEEASTRAH